jgi:hypothetical protein
VLRGLSKDLLLVCKWVCMCLSGYSLGSDVKQRKYCWFLMRAGHSSGIELAQRFESTTHQASRVVQQLGLSTIVFCSMYVELHATHSMFRRVTAQSNQEVDESLLFPEKLSVRL